jgi:hypothetical protein
MSAAGHEFEDREEVERWVVELERRSEVLPERAMRRTVVRERLSQLGPDDLLAFLSVLQTRVFNGRPMARRLLQEIALEPAVFDELDYLHVQQAYRLAKARGREDLAGLFLSAAHHHNPTLDEAFTGNQYDNKPVGVRRAAARLQDRNKLDRLVHDRDHRVIANLLENPRLVERDVIKIAAMRPTRPEVLDLVARHPRWSARYRVRKALACNPYTPESISRRLIPTLLVGDREFALNAGRRLPQSDALPTGEVEMSSEE